MRRAPAALALLVVGFTSLAARADAPEAVRVDVSLGAFSRTLEYNDDYFGFLRDYQGAASLVGIHADVFPGAFAGENLFEDLGLYFDLSRSIGLASSRTDGESFPTVYATRELGIAVRQRIFRQVLALRFGYGSHRFTFENAGPSRPGTVVTPDVPSVDYRFLRIGVESILNVWEGLRLTPSFAYLPVFDAGGIGSDVWFPRATSGGLTLGLEAAYRFRGCLEALVAFEYRRFFHDFHVQVADPYIAGGALDEVFVAKVGARYVFRRRDSTSGAQK